MVRLFDEFECLQHNTADAGGSPCSGGVHTHLDQRLCNLAVVSIDCIGGLHLCAFRIWTSPSCLGVPWCRSTVCPCLSFSGLSACAPPPPLPALLCFCLPLVELTLPFLTLRLPMTPFGFCVLVVCAPLSLLLHSPSGFSAAAI